MAKCKDNTFGYAWVIGLVVLLLMSWWLAAAWFSPVLAHKAGETSADLFLCSAFFAGIAMLLGGWYALLIVMVVAVIIIFNM